MFKKFLILTLIFIVSVIIFSYTGPNVKYPFKQTSWSGGAGQQVFNDNTKFLTSERIHFLTTPLTLGFIEDTNFAVISTYPPAAAGSVTIVNDLVNINDTIFAVGGKKANLSFSTSKGQTWTSFDTLPVNQNNCELLAFEKVNDTIFAGGYWGAVNFGFIYKSGDLKTWNAIGSQPIEAARVYDIVHLNGDTFLIAGGDPDPNSADFDGQVFLTTDRFVTYTKIDTLGFLLVNKIIKYNGDTLIACGDNLIYGEPVYISFDRGGSWIPSGIVDTYFTNNGKPFALTTIEKIGNSLYAGSYGTFGGGLYRSDDCGQNWITLDTTGVIPDTSDITGIYSLDNGTTIYVTATYPGALYKSTDNGITFTLCDIITDVAAVGFIKLGEHTYGVGTTSSTAGGKIYYDSYYKNGYLISSAINIDKYDAVLVSDYFDLYNVFITFNKPSFTTFTLKMRSSSDSTMATATNWASCPSITTYNSYSSNLASISSITNQAGHHYIQYRIDFTTTKMETTPTVDSIWIEKVSGVDEFTKVSKDLVVKFVSPLKLSISSTNSVNLKIFDISGRNVLTENVSTEKIVDLSKLSSGKYILKVYNNTKEVLTKDFTIIK
ncbi:MAG: T9SS type A sorting domain-containing protein [candidate division WOR-3 bacterium]